MEEGERKHYKLRSTAKRDIEEVRRSNKDDATVSDGSAIVCIGISSFISPNGQGDEDQQDDDALIHMMGQTNILQRTVVKKEDLELEE